MEWMPTVGGDDPALVTEIGAGEQEQDGQRTHPYMLRAEAAPLAWTCGASAGAEATERVGGTDAVASLVFPVCFSAGAGTGCGWMGGCDSSSPKWKRGT